MTSPGSLAAAEMNAVGAAEEDAAADVAKVVAEIAAGEAVANSSEETASQQAAEEEAAAKAKAAEGLFTLGSKPGSELAPEPAPDAGGFSFGSAAALPPAAGGLFAFGAVGATAAAPAESTAAALATAAEPTSPAPAPASSVITLGGVAPAPAPALMEEEVLAAEATALKIAEEEEAAAKKANDCAVEKAVEAAVAKAAGEEAKAAAKAAAAAALVAAEAKAAEEAVATKAAEDAIAAEEEPDIKTLSEEELPEGRVAKSTEDQPFLQAASSGNLQELKLFLKDKYARVMTRTQVYTRARSCRSALCVPRARRNMKNEQKATALMLACENQHVDIINELLKVDNGIDVYAVDDKGNTALHYATRSTTRDNGKCLRVLLGRVTAAESSSIFGKASAKRKAEQASLNAEKFINRLNGAGKSALMILAEHDDVVGVETVFDCLETNSSPMIKDLSEPVMENANTSGHTALSHAARSGSCGAVGTLVELDAKLSVRAESDRRMTPLLAAARSMKEESKFLQVVSEMLVEYDKVEDEAKAARAVAQVSRGRPGPSLKESRDVAISCSYDSGSIYIIKTSIGGVEVAEAKHQFKEFTDLYNDLKRELSKLPGKLPVASMFPKHRDRSEQLQNYLNDVLRDENTIKRELPRMRQSELLDMPDCDGITPLFVCVEGGHFNAAKSLLARGANPNLQCGKNLQTALHAAIMLSNHDMVKVLVDASTEESSDGAGRWRERWRKAELERQKQQSFACLARAPQRLLGFLGLRGFEDAVRRAAKAFDKLDVDVGALKRMAPPAPPSGDVAATDAVRLDLTIQRADGTNAIALCAEHNQPHLLELLMNEHEKQIRAAQTAQEKQIRAAQTAQAAQAADPASSTDDGESTPQQAVLAYDAQIRSTFVKGLPSGQWAAWTWLERLTALKEHCVPGEEPVADADKAAQVKAVAAGLINIKKVPLADLLNACTGAVDAKERFTTPLMLSCAKGYAEITRLLLKKGADACAHNPRDGRTALRLAIDHKHVETVRIFISNISLTQAKLCFSKTTHDGATPLMAAVLTGNEEIVRALCQDERTHGTRGEYTKEGLNVMHLAVLRAPRKVPDLVKLLAECHPSLLSLPADSGRYHGCTPLMLARCLEDAIALVEAGCNTDAVNPQLRGRNALMLWMLGATPEAEARDAERTSMMRYLVPRTNLDTFDSDGKTVLMLGMQDAQHHLGVLLLEYIKDKASTHVNVTREPGGPTVAMVAAHVGNMDGLRQLIQVRADLTLQLSERAAKSCFLERLRDGKTYSGATALFLAVCERHLEAVELLSSTGLAQGVLDCKAASGLTPATAACKRHYLDVLTVLCSAGCDLPTKEFFVGSKLEAALNATADGGIHVLLKPIKGPAVGAIADGCTPLSLFARAGRVELVEMALQVWKKMPHHRMWLLSAKDDHKRTCMHHAVEHDPRNSEGSEGASKVVQLLLREGADPFDKGSDGTPLMRAVAQGNHTVQRAFVENAIRRFKNPVWAAKAEGVVGKDRYGALLIYVEEGDLCMVIARLREQPELIDLELNTRKVLAIDNKTSKVAVISTEHHPEICKAVVDVLERDAVRSLVEKVTLVTSIIGLPSFYSDGLSRKEQPVFDALVGKIRASVHQVLWSRLAAPMRSLVLTRAFEAQLAADATDYMLVQSDQSDHVPTTAIVLRACSVTRRASLWALDANVSFTVDDKSSPDQVLQQLGDLQQPLRTWLKEGEAPPLPPQLLLLDYFAVVVREAGVDLSACRASHIEQKVREKAGIWKEEMIHSPQNAQLQTRVNASILLSHILQALLGNSAGGSSGAVTRTVPVAWAADSMKVLTLEKKVADITPPVPGSTWAAGWWLRSCEQLLESEDERAPFVSAAWKSGNLDIEEKEGVYTAKLRHASDDGAPPRDSHGSTKIPWTRGMEFALASFSPGFRVSLLAAMPSISSTFFTVCGVSVGGDKLLLRVENAPFEASDVRAVAGTGIKVLSRSDNEPTLPYCAEQGIVLEHKGELKGATVREWLGGNRYLLSVGTNPSQVVAVDLHTRNHASNINNTDGVTLTREDYDGLEQVREDYLRFVMDERQYVEDAITGNTLKIHEQLLDITTEAGNSTDGSITGGAGVQDRDEWSKAKNVKDLSPLLLAPSLARKHGTHETQPVLLCAAPGTGKTWSTLQLMYELASNLCAAGETARSATTIDREAVRLNREALEVLQQYVDGLGGSVPRQLDKALDMVKRTGEALERPMVEGSIAVENGASDNDAADEVGCSLPLVPIIVFVQAFSQWVRSKEREVNASTLIEFIARDIDHRVDAQKHDASTKAKYKRYAKLLRVAFEMRAVVLCIDGIDEAADLKDKLSDLVINKLVQLGHRVVATSRPEGVKPLSRFAQFVVMNLKPLDDEQTKQAITRQLAVGMKTGDETNQTFFKHLMRFTQIRKEHDDLYVSSSDGDTRESLETLQQFNDSFVVKSDGPAAFSSADVGKRVDISGSMVHVDDKPRLVYWGSLKHSDVSGTIDSVVSSVKGEVRLRDGAGAFPNPKPVRLHPARCLTAAHPIWHHPMDCSPRCSGRGTIRKCGTCVTARGKCKMIASSRPTLSQSNRNCRTRAVVSSCRPSPTSLRGNIRSWKWGAERSSRALFVRTLSGRRARISMSSSPRTYRCFGSNAS